MTRSFTRTLLLLGALVPAGCAAPRGETIDPHRSAEAPPPPPVPPPPASAGQR